MKNNKSIFAILIFFGIVIFLGWFFSDILIFMFAALVLSFLGSPLVKLLRRIRIKTFRFPDSLAAAITLLVIIGIIFGTFYFVIPIISRQIHSLATIDTTTLTAGVEEWINKFDPLMRKLGVMGQYEHCSSAVTNEWKSVIDKIDISRFVTNSLTATGSILIALFSILFMTFFSLKDHTVFFKMIKRWLPHSYRDNFDHILEATRKQLSSYFTGVFIEMLIVGALEAILCLIFRVPNAILIGCIGGLLNIIPYVGPLIACIISIIISITSLIPLTPEAQLITTTVIKVLIAFGLTKLLDDLIIQPYVYGKKTQTHPLEIFIIILMAGYVGGVLAMIFAVPAYTFIRIVVKEFFGAYYFTEPPSVAMTDGNSPQPDADSPQTAADNSQTDVDNSQTDADNPQTDVDNSQSDVVKNES